MTDPEGANDQATGTAIVPGTNVETETETGAGTVLEQGQHDAIEADEVDSAIGDVSDRGSVTTSLASSIYDYTYEPNDDAEQNRLDMLHHIFKLVLGGNLFKAPITEPLQRVLDFGTGTGIWAIDLADEHPSAQVQGTDLSPIQPIWIPPNLKFVVDDCESSWPEDEHEVYDYVHGRSMSGSIANWSALFTEAFKALKPGGWLEMQEFDVWFRSEEGQLPADSKITEWQQYLDQASLLFGKRLNVANEFKEKMIEVGFEDVVDDIIKVPIGAWPKDKRLKEQGRWLQAQMLDSIEPISLGYCSRILKWSDVQTQVFIAAVRNEFLNNRTHLFVYCHFIYGRKPGSKGGKELQQESE